jgi:hypothetical protein
MLDTTTGEVVKTKASSGCSRSIRELFNGANWPNG